MPVNTLKDHFSGTSRRQSPSSCPRAWERRRTDETERERGREEKRDREGGERH